MILYYLDVLEVSGLHGRPQLTNITRGQDIQEQGEHKPTLRRKAEIRCINSLYLDDRLDTWRLRK